MYIQKYAAQVVGFVLLLVLVAGCSSAPAPPPSAVSGGTPTVGSPMPTRPPSASPTEDAQAALLATARAIPTLTPASTPTPDPRIRAAIPVGETGVAGIAAGAGAIWALSRAEEAVKRIDPQTNQVTATINGIGADANVIEVGAGAVWVTSEDDGTLSQIGSTRLNSS